MERLIKIQNELIAPKDQKGQGVRYSFRSAEGILKSLKPLLFREKLCLVMSDEIILKDNLVYVQSTAILFDSTGKELIRANGFAREEKGKMPMAAAQLTGATSSYARKYALGALFLCDDTKDIDHYASQQQPVQQQQQQQQSYQQPMQQQTPTVQQQPAQQPVQQVPPPENNADVWENGRKKLTEWCMAHQQEGAKWFDYYKIKGTNDLTHDQIKHMGSIVFKK